MLLGQRPHCDVRVLGSRAQHVECRLVIHSVEQGEHPFTLRTDTTTFWIVDAFPSDAERQEHLEGAIASSLLANAERLLDGPPEILPAEVLAAKLPQ